MRLAAAVKEPKEVTPMVQTEILHAVMKVGSKARIDGVQCGALKVHHVNARHVVLHKSGNKFWSGLYQPWRYSPASFVVMEILEEISDSRHRVRVVIEFPIRTSPQEVLGAKTPP